MNLQNLRAFVVVAETGSISRAALRLHLTQSATTRRVQNFEASLGGTPLLDRRTKPLVVTPAGRQVLERCQEVLRAIATLEDRAAADGDPWGELRIGVGMGAEVVLDAPLDFLRRRFPRLDLRVSTQWTAMLIEALRTGNLDVAVAFVTKDHTVPASVVLNAVGRETLLVVAARDAKIPRVRGRRLSLIDLRDHRWVLNPIGCAYRLAVQRAHDAAGVPLQIAAEVIGKDMQLSLVARGVGFGLASQRVLRKSAYRQQLQILPIADFALEASVAILRARALGRLDPVVDLLQKQIMKQLQR